MINSIHKARLKQNIIFYGGEPLRQFQRTEIQLSANVAEPKTWNNRLRIINRLAERIENCPAMEWRSLSCPKCSKVALKNAFRDSCLSPFCFDEECLKNKYRIALHRFRKLGITSRRLIHVVFGFENVDNFTKEISAQHRAVFHLLQKEMKKPVYCCASCKHEFTFIPKIKTFRMTRRREAKIYFLMRFMLKNEGCKTHAWATKKDVENSLWNLINERGYDKRLVFEAMKLSNIPHETKPLPIRCPKCQGLSTRITSPTPLKMVMARDLLARNKPNQKKIYIHYHAGLLPVNMDDFMKNISVARRNVIEKTETEFTIINYSYKSTGSVLKYLAKRVAGQFSHANKPGGLYGYSKIMNLEQYYDEFYNTRAVSFFGLDSPSEARLSRIMLDNSVKKHPTHCEFCQTKLEYVRNSEINFADKPPPPPTAKTPEIQLKNIVVTKIK